MSEPVKKPGQQPESYDPRTPEIVGMVEVNQMLRSKPQVSGKNSIAYNFEFSFCNGKNFCDCFSSAYKYLTRDDKQLAKFSQCDWFFIFGALSSQNMTRLPYNEADTEAEWLVANTQTQIDLIWGFSGFDYEVQNGNFAEAITASIDAGTPVIAKISGQVTDCFRLISGYQKDKLISPSGDVTLAGIEYLHLFGERIVPRYTFVDAVRQMKRVLEHNREKGYWAEYQKQFHGYFDQKLNEGPAAEVKKRFDRVVEAMQHTFNCHNLGCAMGCIKDSKELQNLLDTGSIEQYKYAFDLFSDACFTIHLNAWIPIEINKLVKWKNRGRAYKDTNSEWALGNAIAGAIGAIDHYDKMLLEAVDDMLRFLD